MFTGLIEETGKIKKILRNGDSIRFSVSARKILDGISPGDSININGVCQTVVNFDKNSFEVDTVEETLKKTTLGRVRLNEKVNLESSLTLEKKLGGHFVLGHTDTTGKILNIKKLISSYVLSINYPEKFSIYIVNVGAIAVDGISLTIASYDDKKFDVSIIPHTWQNTNLREKKTGSEVNLEFDILGKYAAKILGKDNHADSGSNWLKEIGY